VTDQDPGFDMSRARRRWLPSEAPPEGQRASLFRLADAVRRVIEAMMESDADVATLDGAAESAEQLAALLEQGPRGRALIGFAEASNSGDTAAGYDNSPLIGPANPIAPPLRMRVEGQRVIGSATFGNQFEGPPGRVHGGVVASAFDELLGMVQSLLGNPGMTGRLVVNYRRPTPLHRELRFEGWVDHVEGRKTFTSGTLYDGGTLCAEAEGLFIAVDFARLEAIARGEAEQRWQSHDEGS
jgi:acyl-coenzyme A thioesterase PaaI-like protein